ncbi:3591_t:CDS:2 [Funneliformis geosporum]|uniref:539_t:CDS:1 n=1 Tax=Funneliformis geosporum TaxID=1117311 RepID=A0A9W4SQX1_9GLOM|nr:3591_t:CDS:2 [Funneliformis geosporum]CAI2177227.1 539_t:CDS:2 [Funneliformis geosporum]
MTSSILPTVREVNEWSFQKLGKFLKSKEINDEDIKIIIDEQKVDGSSFLGITAISLERWGILGGPALKIEKLVKEIQCGTKPFTEDQDVSVSFLIDNSNFLNQGKDILKREEKTNINNVRVDYDRLRTIILNGRKLSGPAEIFYSSKNSHYKLWEKLKDQDFEVKALEKRVNTTLVARGMKFIYTKDPGTLVIVAGDSDYSPLVENALEKGWKVEIWYWSSGLSEELRIGDKFGRNYSFHNLDYEYKKFVYARGPEAHRKFTLEIEHEWVKDLRDENLLSIFVLMDLFGWWHWTKDDHLLVYVNTLKQKEEVENWFEQTKQHFELAKKQFDSTKTPKQIIESLRGLIYALDNRFKNPSSYDLGL